MKEFFFFFQVTPSDVLPASMFIPVPSPDREAQSAPISTANSISEDSKKQVGQYLMAKLVYVCVVFPVFFINIVLLMPFFILK